MPPWGIERCTALDFTAANLPKYIAFSLDEARKKKEPPRTIQDSELSGRDAIILEPGLLEIKGDKCFIRKLFCIQKSKARPWSL